MRKSAKTLIITAVCVTAVGALAAIAAPVIYRDFIAAPAADAPRLSADDSALQQAAGAPLDPADFSGDWSIGAGSFAGYRVDEVLNGTAVTVTGRTESVTGTLSIDALTLSEASFSVDVASIATDNPQRDNYFRTEVAHTDTHPTATFVLSAPTSVPKMPRSGEVISQEISGELTLNGVTHTVSFTAQIQATAPSVEQPASAQVSGQIPIAFADFDMTAPTLGFVSVEQKGIVEFTLNAQPSA